MLRRNTTIGVFSFVPKVVFPVTGRRLAHFQAQEREPTIAGLLTGRKSPPSSGTAKSGGLLAGRWWDTPGFAVGSIAVADVALYGAWKLAFRHPSAMDAMEKHFTASFKNVRAGRLWTLATSSLSHSDLGQVLSNVNAVYSCGLPIAQMLGPRTFLALYLGSGVASAAALVAVDAIRARRRNKPPENDPNLGGSGAVTGMLTTFALSFPHSIVLINGYVRLPVIFEVAATWLYDLFNIGRESQTGVSHAGHFAGALCGALFWVLRVWKK